jgi:hypothetical protein
MAGQSAEDPASARHVGFGSFYNLFESKAAIVEAVLVETVARAAERSTR